MVRPEQAKVMTWSPVTVEGGRVFSRRLEQPKSTLGFYHDIAVLG